MNAFKRLAAKVKKTLLSKAFSLIVILLSLLISYFQVLPASASGIFIAAPNRVDMVHDPLRNVLYITSGGDVLRYSLAEQQFLLPLHLGGNLKGLDLSPDANTLAVADYSFTGVHLLDLRSEIDQKVTFTQASYEGGAFSVAFGNDGNILVSTGSMGWGPLRKFNIFTGETITILSQVTANTMLSGSADGSVIGFAESNISDGRWGRYRVSDGTVVERTGYIDGTASSNYEIATNRNGTQFAIPRGDGAFIYNADFLRTAKIGLSGQAPIGAVYHPTADLVYFAWGGTNEVRVFDTNSFSQITAFDFENTFPSNTQFAYQQGRMKISRDGSLLFVTVTGGIRYIDTLTTDVVPDYQLTVGTTGSGPGFITSTPAGIYCPSVCTKEYAAGQQITLNATPVAGSTFAGWSGAGCTGTGTCLVTLAAATTVTATFVQGDSGTASAFIPVPDCMDMVHDPGRNILYITSGEQILRYSLAQRQFLAPFHLGGGLKGIDLSPDANTLAVADSTDSIAYLINLSTGTSRKISFPNGLASRGTLSVAFGSDGNVLVSTTADWSPLYKYDLATGETITLLPEINRNTMLRSSADGNVIGFAEGTSSDGPWGRYRVSDNSIVHRAGYTNGTSFTNKEIGTNRNGTQFAILTYGKAYIYNADFLKIATIGQADQGPVGVVYHPGSDIVYFTWSNTTEIRAFETNNFRQIGAFNFEDSFALFSYFSFRQGRLKISRDGLLLFATVTGGIRYVNTTTETLPQYQLAVSTAGSGAGFITSSPNGIYCPSVCTGEYTAGQWITLSASPLPGSIFSGWSGAGCTGTGACLVNMEAAKAVTALFTPGGTDEASIFIPAPDRVDMVPDPLRNILYITAGEDVVRYSLTDRQFLAPFHLGGTLKGIDLSPDANTLAVADNSLTGIYLIDLPSGISRKVLFTPSSSEGGAFSVVFGKDGNILVTTSFFGSGWVPLRKYKIFSGDTITLLPSIRQDTMLSSSADGSVIAFAESNASGGPWGRYLVDGNTVERANSTGYNFEIGTNRNGSQFAIPRSGGAFIYNSDFLKIATIGLSGQAPIGAVYHPTADLVYFAWGGTKEVRAFETNNFSQVAAYNFENAFSAYSSFAYREGRLKISRDGSLLFATVTGGVRYVATATDLTRHQLTVNTGGSGAGFVIGSPAGIYCPSVCTVQYLTGQQILLSASPLPGSIFSGWSGSGCSGTGTCLVSMDAAKTVTATFLSWGTAETGILIPAPERVDMVHDPLRNVLYITSGADVLRFSLARQQFLAPFHLSGNLKGIDLSPDVNLLAVADNYFTGVHLIDLTSETIQKVTFTQAFYEGGAFSVAFGRDGSLLTSTSFNGSGWVPLRKYNTISGETSMLLSSIRQDTMLASSADGSVIGFAESNSSDGPWGRYRVLDNNVVARTGYDNGTSWFNYEIATNRNGTQFAVPTYGGTFIYNADYLKIVTIGQYAEGRPIGVVYHPIEDLIYCAWAETNQIRVFETNKFREVKTFNLGTVFQNTFHMDGNSAYQQGRLKISRDGSLLLATVPGGILYLNAMTGIALTNPLTIGIAGSGAGLVTSSPAGISCPSLCEDEYPSGEQITLIATPIPGSTFSGWSGGGCTGVWSCSINMETAKRVSALFASPKGDINGTGDIDLADAILALQIVVNSKAPQEVYRQFDVDGDLKIGLAEAVYDLQSIARLRNNPVPLLYPIGNKIVEEGGRLLFTIGADNGDGDPLTFLAADVPYGASFNPQTKTFSWTPNYAQSGTYHVTFSVSDDHGGQASETIVITVNDIPVPP